MNRTRKLIIAIIFASVAALAVAAQAKNVTGDWKFTLDTPNGSGMPSCTFKQEGEELSGTYKGRSGEAPLKGTVKGNEIKFNVKVNFQGNEFVIEYAGTVDSDTMKGKVKFGEFGEGTFSGKKE